MDYPNRQRLKLMAHVELMDANDHPVLLSQVQDAEYSGRIERVVVMHVVVFDWNCPQHITPRFTSQEFEA